MSKDATLSNPDLVRHLVSLGGAGIASSSKTIRDAQSPCAPLYERWQRSGCEAHSEAERRCLRAIGGPGSLLCTGTFSLVALANGWPQRREFVPAASVADRVATLFGEPPRPNVTTVMEAIWMGSKLIIQSGKKANFLFFIGPRRRPRFPHNRFALTHCQVIDAVRTIMTRVGNTQLPTVPFGIRVPRALSIAVSRDSDDGRQEALRWPLLNADRLD